MTLTISLLTYGYLEIDSILGDGGPGSKKTFEVWSTENPSKTQHIVLQEFMVENCYTIWSLVEEGFSVSPSDSFLAKETVPSS